VNYIHTVETISRYKQAELLALPLQVRWLWILGAGCIPLDEVIRTPRLISPTSVFQLGQSVRSGFDRLDSISACYAYYEFKEIVHSLDSDCIIAYTDGSFSNGTSGSGAAIYRNNIQIHKISSPTGHTSIAYAELFAILAVLRWLKHSSSNFHGCEVHFFTDNAFTRTSLCDSVLPKTHFFLIQDIKHLASSLTSSHRFLIHWIPSHIDKHTYGQFRIAGNCCADRLAGEAQVLSTELPDIPSIEIIREKILDESALLTWSITNLLDLSSAPPSDGPSSDDFSSANADQIVLLEDDL